MDTQAYPNYLSWSAKTTKDVMDGWFRERII